MTEETILKPEKFLLKGSQNFVQWLTKLNNHCLLNDLMNGKNWPDSIIFPEPTETMPNPTGIQPTTAQLKKAKQIKMWINENIDYSSVSIDATSSLSTIMEILHNSYGSMHLDPEAFKESLKNKIYFDPSFNPQATLNWLDNQLKLLSAMQVTAEEYKRILLHGIGPKDDSKPHEHFWFHLFGQMKTMPANKEQLRKAIWNYWSAYRSDAIKVDQATATAPMVPNRQEALGNLVQERALKIQRKRFPY